VSTSVAPPRAAVKSNSLARERRRERLIARAILLPALVFSLVMTQIPFLVTIVFSTLQWNLLKPKDFGFAGFDNYVSVFQSGDLLPSIIATGLITTLSVLFSVGLGLVFAVLLDRKFVGRSVARTLLITPFLIMPAAAALLWKYSLLDTNIGVINWAVSALGFSPVSWSTDHPMMSVVIVLAWQYTPFMTLILLAGLQSQGADVLEAAAVDGAGFAKTFRWVTLPHLRHYIEIAVLLGSIMLLQIFDPIAILTKGTGGTKTLAYLLYERAFIGLNVGEAAAYGVIVVLLTIVVATVALRTLFSVFKVGGDR